MRVTNRDTLRHDTELNPDPYFPLLALSDKGVFDSDVTIYRLDFNLRCRLNDKQIS